MMNLNEVRNGQQYRITWLLGNNGRYLKDNFHLREEDQVHVISNLHGNVLISHDGRQYAMDKTFANAVKVDEVA